MFVKHKNPTTRREKGRDEYIGSIGLSITLILGGIALIVAALMRGRSDYEIIIYIIIAITGLIFPGIFFAYRAFKRWKIISELGEEADKDMLDELDVLDERKWGKKYWLQKAEAELEKNHRVQDGEYVTIFSYFNTIDAEIAKANLISEGIECVFLDKNIPKINPLPIIVAVSAIKLQVKKDDVKRAMEILAPNTKTPCGG